MKKTSTYFTKNTMFYKFSLYGFLKNLRFFEPFLLLFFLDLGFSFFQMGILFAVRDFSANLLEIPAGVLADTFGRRKSMLLSFGSYILSFVIFTLSSSYPLLLFAMLLFALGNALRSGTHKALILEYLQIEGLHHLKVNYYGHTRSASQFGSAINSLLAAGLVFYSGSYRYIFGISIIPYLLDLINLASYPAELDGALIVFQKGTMLKQMRATVHTFLAIFKEPRTIRALVNSSSFTAFFKVTKDYLQPIVTTLALSLPFLLTYQNAQRSAVLLGGVYFIIYLFSSYAARHAAQFQQRIGQLPQAINITFLIGAVFLFSAGIATRFELNALAILVFLGFYMLQNIRKPQTVAFISDQISSQVMAAGLSVESQFTNIIMVVLAPLTGALVDLWGIGATLGILGAGMLLLSWLVKVDET
ncbi:MAG: MFS transporter [Chloroflexota bacterium]|nr:MFS transporter [Chloroflexota bacterium]